MPGYSMMFQKGWKALPWTWADERLSTAHNYNLAANPSCMICPEGASEAVILEGLTQELKDPNVRRQVRDAYKKKYDSDLDSYSADPIYAVRPRVVFGLVESSDKIHGNTTRWRFSAS